MRCIDELIQSNYKTLIKFGIAITKSKVNSPDLISETYLDIIERNKPAPCDNKQFLLYFYRYMLLVNYSNLKRERKFKQVEVHDVPDQEPEVNKEELFNKIEQFKNSLDELDKTLFRLSYEEGLSYRKISEIHKASGYNITVQSIYTLMKPLNSKILQLNK